MEGLTEGRIVHFVMPDGAHRPAIVVRVWRLYDGAEGDESKTVLPSNGCCNLTVFTDWLNDGKSGPLQWETSVIYSEKQENRTWHWIERA